jgi:hypothetical protein
LVKGGLKVERKLFTLEEANGLLPFINRDLEALQAVKRKFELAYVELREKRAHTPAANLKTAEDPFFDLECEMEFMQIEARTLINSIRMKHVELKDIERGLVDFPSVLEGREVLLCWHQGEEKIGYYHGWHDGFAGRKPIQEA